MSATTDKQPSEPIRQLADSTPDPIASDDHLRGHEESLSNALSNTKLTGEHAESNAAPEQAAAPTTKSGGDHSIVGNVSAAAASVGEAVYASAANVFQRAPDLGVTAAISRWSGTGNKHHAATTSAQHESTAEPTAATEPGALLPTHVTAQTDAEQPIVADDRKAEKGLARLEPALPQEGLAESKPAPQHEHLEPESAKEAERAEEAVAAVPAIEQQVAASNPAGLDKPVTEMEPQTENKLATETTPATATGTETEIPTAAGSGTTLSPDASVRPAAEKERAISDTNVAGAASQTAGAVGPDHSDLSRPAPNAASNVASSVPSAHKSESQSEAAAHNDFGPTQSESQNSDHTLVENDDDHHHKKGGKSFGQKLKEKIKGEVKLLSGHVKKDEDRVVEGKALKQGVDKSEVQA
ncbi:hypothetical protein ACQY0O_006749 [Thecaphora frezii]